MHAKKILILIPDGVGLRNFAYTKFYRMASERGFEITFWNMTPFDLSQIGYREIRIENPRMHPLTAVLKIIRTRVELNRNIRKSGKEIYKCYRFRLPARSIKEAIKNLAIYSYLGIFGTSGIGSIRKWIRNKEMSTPDFRGYLETLRREKPDLVFCTNQRTVLAIAPLLAAEQLNIPTATFIFSWDNLPKATMALEPDYYLVWSAHMKSQLQYFYEYINDDQVYITGTPQFEPHNYPELLMTKEDFFSEYNLDPTREYICFSGDDVTTSPFDQQYLHDLGKAVRDLNTQGYNLGIVFRRCPVDFSARYDNALAEYSDIIVSANPKWVSLSDKWNAVLPTAADLKLQINTIAHTKMVLNLGSSMVFDYASFRKPTAFFRYDGGPVKKCRGVHSIYRFIHFESMPANDAVFWIDAPQEIQAVIKKGLSEPENVVREASVWFEKINIHPTSMASSRILDTFEKIINKRDAAHS